VGEAVAEESLIDDPLRPLATSGASRKLRGHEACDDDRADPRANRAVRGRKVQYN
jgi:hypothetical protein